MKIAIIGAGAMGSLFGGLLHEAGNEVHLIDVWKEHVDVINENGLKIEGISGDRVVRVKAHSKASDVGPCELVIVFVKSTFTKAAISDSLSLVDENTVILTLQNGLGNADIIGEVMGQDRVIAGVTSFGSTLLGPGRVRHAGSGDTYIGALGHLSDKRIEEVSKVLSQSGIKALHSKDVMSLIWSKLIVNVGINALTAITGLLNGELIEYAETEELLELAVKEAIEVAKTKGIKLINDEPVVHVKEVCKLTATNKSSMLQDMLNKKKSEIDFINGAIVREGEKLGIQTPVNTVLTNLVKIKEKMNDRI